MGGCLYENLWEEDQEFRYWHPLFLLQIFHSRSIPLIWIPMVRLLFFDGVEKFHHNHPSTRLLRAVCYYFREYEFHLERLVPKHSQLCLHFDLLMQYRHLQHLCLENC